MTITYTNREGEDVTVEQNPDGSFTVMGETGSSTTYGADSAEHIAQDWGIDFNDHDFAGGGDAGGGDAGGGEGGGGEGGGGGGGG